MEHEKYLAEIVEYYNHSRIPCKPGFAASFKADIQFPMHWAHGLVAELSTVLAGKRVLEMACGGGRWTQIAADVAEHVTATDVSQNLLDNAAGLPLPDGKVDFIQCDAFDVEQIKGNFDAGLHMNFINHLPLDSVPTFLDRFHAKLEPNAIVLCGCQKFRGWATEPVYEIAETGDIASQRHTDDGKPVEVIDTLFTEDLMRGLLAGRARSLHFSMNKWWWWARYTVGHR